GKVAPAGVPAPEVIGATEIGVVAGAEVGGRWAGGAERPPDTVLPAITPTTVRISEGSFLRTDSHIEPKPSPLPIKTRSRRSLAVHHLIAQAMGALRDLPSLKHWTGRSPPPCECEDARSTGIPPAHRIATPPINTRHGYIPCEPTRDRVKSAWL